MHSFKLRAEKVRPHDMDRREVCGVSHQTSPSRLLSEGRYLILRRGARTGAAGETAAGNGSGGAMPVRRFLALASGHRSKPSLTYRSWWGVVHIYSV